MPTRRGDLEGRYIKVTSLNLTASYPLVFSEGRTVLVNELGYTRVVLDYTGFPEAAANPENMHAIEYNATVTHGLSDKWTLMGIATPGIASDFEGDVGSDDLTFLPRKPSPGDLPTPTCCADQRRAPMGW